MVKIQKPTPKNLGNKPKLDNPIKKKKQQLKKDKSAITKKAKLLDDSTPVKEAKISHKPQEIIAKKQNKKELNGEKKSVAKKPLIIAPPESPVQEKQQQNGKGKKNKLGKGKNVETTNGVAKPAPKPVEVPVKVNKKDKVAAVQKAPVSDKKPEKPAKKVKPPVAKEVAVPVKVAPPTKAKAAPAPALSKSTAPQKKPVVPAPAPVKAQKKPENAAALQVKTAVPAQTSKPGKKQKNKKKATSQPEATPAIEKIKKVKKPKAALQEKKMAKIAFKKAKLAGKGGESKTAEKKPTKEDEATFRYDPIPYDEEQFNAIVNLKNIKKIAEALKTTVEKEVKTKKSTIFDDYRYFLQVASFKIPSCPKRMIRLNLKHSLVDKDDDVLLVVPDLQRGGKVDYEPTKHHYEDLLREKGIEGITVMPMNQLRKEYRTFEQKRRLCASYEYFMCDGRIVAHVGAMVGKLTQRTRNSFHAVRLNDNKDLKAEIEKAMKKTAFRQVAKSSLQSIPVGSHKFSAQQLAENIELVVAQLKTIYPGGLGNIRNLHLKIGLTGTSSLPLYISMAQAPDETPNVVGIREERMIKLKREANEVLSKFSMTKEGKLIKLTKSAAEKKRALMETKAALKEDESTDEPEAKKSKKSKKESVDDGKKKNKKVKKVLELPENEEEEDDDTNDDDDENVLQLGQGSDDETEDDEMANLDEEDTESGAEIVENGFVGEDDVESEEDDDDEQEVGGNDEDDDDEEDDNDDDDDEDDEEESD